MKRVGGVVVVISFALAEAISLQGGASSANRGKDGPWKKDPYHSTLPRVEGYFPITMDENTVQIHKVAFWRQKEDYFTRLSYVNPKNGKRSFNSCMDKEVSAQDVCNSHGTCAPFDRTDIVNPIFFCRCDMGWAGPECTIKQKSQTVAWSVSLFLGIIGADEYYLEQYVNCVFKIIGLVVGLFFYALGMGHVGTITVLSYWLYDIVRIGSAAVSTPTAKVAADLPRWAFACFTMLYFGFIAFCMGISKVYWSVKAKRRAADMETFYCACDEYGTPTSVKMVNGLPEKYAAYANAYGADWNNVVRKMQSQGIDPMRRVGK